jgi:hypothetical protein
MSKLTWISDILRPIDKLLKTPTIEETPKQLTPMLARELWI